MLVANYNGHAITKGNDGRFFIDNGAALDAWDPAFEPVSVLQNIFSAGGSDSSQWPQPLRNGWDALAPALGLVRSGGMLTRPATPVFYEAATGAGSGQQETVTLPPWLIWGGIGLAAYLLLK